MRTGRHIVGIASVLAGLAMLVPAAILLNQRLNLFPASWGIFDIQVGSVRVSDTTAECIFGGIGLVLLLAGSVLLAKRSGRA